MASDRPLDLGNGLRVAPLPPRGLKRRRRRHDVPEEDAAAAEAGGDEAEAKRARAPDADGGAAGAGAEALPAREKKFEYLDHTADIQVHAWGSSLAEAFENAAIAMFGYMTELEAVDVDPSRVVEIEADGPDLNSLLYKFLDELLFAFSTEDTICRDVRIVLFDRGGLRLKARGHGERFDLAKHEQGTEIKAITYSNMQIHEREDGSAEVFVILDI